MRNLAMRMNPCKSITTDPPRTRSSFRKAQFQAYLEHLNEKDLVEQPVANTSHNKMHPPGYNSYLASGQPSEMNHSCLAEYFLLKT